MNKSIEESKHKEQKDRFWYDWNDYCLFKIENRMVLEKDQLKVVQIAKELKK